MATITKNTALLFFTEGEDGEESEVCKSANFPIEIPTVKISYERLSQLFQESDAILFDDEPCCPFWSDEDVFFGKTMEEEDEEDTLFFSRDDTFLLGEDGVVYVEKDGVVHSIAFLYKRPATL